MCIRDRGIVVYKFVERESIKKEDRSNATLPIHPSTTLTIDEYAIKIVEMKDVKLDYSKMPSYCKPESYTIVHFVKGYRIQLPGGSLYNEYYNTPEEARNEIIEVARRSKERWVESGGTTF